MSVWMASRMWPRCRGPLAYGNALVTRIRRRWVMPNYATLCRADACDAVGAGARGDCALRGLANLLETEFVDCLFEGFFAGDLLLIQQRLNGHVHQSHAYRRTALHRVFQLVHLALPYQIGDRGRIDQDLEGRDAALFIGRGDEL